MKKAASKIEKTPEQKAIDDRTAQIELINDLREQSLELKETASVFKIIYNSDLINGAWSKDDHPSDLYRNFELLRDAINVMAPRLFEVSDKLDKLTEALD